MLLVEHASHLVFFNDEHGGGRDGGRCGHANGLAREAPFAKEIARSQNGHDGFFAGLIDDRKLHTTFLNVHDIGGGIALREDNLLALKVADLATHTGGVEK